MGQLRKRADIDTLILSFFTECFDEQKAEAYFRVVHLQANDFRVLHTNLTEYVYSHFDKVKRTEDGNTGKIYWQDNVHTLHKYLSKLLANLANSNNQFTTEEIKKINEHKKEISELSAKINDGIDLAIIQYKQFFKSLDVAKEGLGTAKSVLDGVNKEYASAKKQLNEAKKATKKATNKLDNSTSDFITMLGIFSALIFAVFGGFNAFKSIFKNIAKASVSMVIIDSSILMLGLIILVFLLIQSISILSRRPFLACGDAPKECHHRFYKKYPLFSFSISLFLFMLLLGLLCKANNKLPFNWSLEPILFYLDLIIIIFIIVALIFFSYKYFKNKK